MLEIDVILEESYDEETSIFVTTQKFRIDLEHSLTSLSKWEIVWEKPFLSNVDKTTEEMISYVRMMILTKDVDEKTFHFLMQNHLDQIHQYIGSKQTATWFSDASHSRQNREIITSEIIYYWMVSLQIPFECQQWHLNRLITLIRVINQKNAPAKRMSPQKAARQRQELNRQRRAQHGTTG